MGIVLVYSLFLFSPRGCSFHKHFHSYKNIMLFISEDFAVFKSMGIMKKTQKWYMTPNMFQWASNSFQAQASQITTTTAASVAQHHPLQRQPVCHSVWEEMRLSQPRAESDRTKEVGWEAEQSMGEHLSSGGKGGVSSAGSWREFITFCSSQPCHVFSVGNLIATCWWLGPEA